MKVLNVKRRKGGRKIEKKRKEERKKVYIRNGEIDLRLMRRREKMKKSIGRKENGDIESNRVIERRESGDGERKKNLVIMIVIEEGEIEDKVERLEEEEIEVWMGGESRKIEGKRKEERLGKEINRIGSENERKRKKGREGGKINRIKMIVGIMVVGRRKNGVKEVEIIERIIKKEIEWLNRKKGEEKERNIEKKRRNKNEGSDIVEIGDEENRIGEMRIENILERVGDEIKGGERIENEVMENGDEVIERNGIELIGEEERNLDLEREEMEEIIKMKMEGKEMGERVKKGDNRIEEIIIINEGGEK